METLLRIEELEKYYGAKTLITKALDNISFSVEKGEFLGHHGSLGKRQDYSSQLHFHYRYRNSRTHLPAGYRYHRAKGR